MTLLAVSFAAPIAARRTFRMAIVVSLASCIAYGIAMPMPFYAPMLAVMLTGAPGPPPGLKGLLGLLGIAAAILCTGLVMITLLLNYPVSAVLIIAVGLYASSVIAIKYDQAPIGVLFAIGLTMVPAAGIIDYSLGVAMIEGLLLGVAIAVICQWLVYPWLPDSPESISPRSKVTVYSARWLALRGTLIALPAVMLAFSNPSLYMAAILKSLALAQQGTEISAKRAGRELLVSTVLGGCFAMLFWFALQAAPTLWFFTLWMLLFIGYGAAKSFRAIASRFTASCWQSTLVTMLILLGPAVQDSANGKDVYQAFAVRMGVFIAVTLYAWLAITAFERLRLKLRVKHQSVVLENT
jgi:hypothetical protein